MQYLQKLYLNKCCNLETIPDSIDGMPFLSVLCLIECGNLETIPDNIQNSRLEFLDLDECRNLKSLQKLPVSLLHLIAVNCTYLDTESILKNMLDSIVAQYTCYIQFHLDQISFLPGAQVPHCFPYRTTEASIDIPSIVKSNLSCFIVCIIFSEGLYVTHDSSSIDCTVYENKKLADQSFVRVHVGAHRILISDHVLLFIHSVDGLKWEEEEEEEEESESEGDYYNLSFEFKYSFDYQNYDDDSEDEDDDRIRW
ncbi:unnamed protein product [Trifolium pratense]|uniref:Uncharacterized protein n=1 Tax=Trifolium pratense TaxID=57577 RepID=A0ACB0LIY3_TRIPR|nr:unnamed protein product [Trifolium pratense]